MSSNTEKNRRPPGIGEFLFNELRSAVRDARQKLLDEGWFGRRSASNTQADGFSFDLNPPASPADALYGRQPTFEEQWAVRERAPDKAAHERGQDIDR